MENKTTVCIPIETSVRELDGKLLVAAHLLNNNTRVFIGDRRGIKNEISHLKNAIYFTKSLDPSLEDFYDKVLSNNNKIVNMNVEGGVLYEDVQNHFINAYPVNMLKKVDKLFLFGEKIKSHFLEYLGNVYEDKLVVSGEPRFDLLDKKYSKYFKNETNRIKKEFGEYILINTSFSMANPFVGEEKIFSFLENSHAYNDEATAKLRIKRDFYKKILKDYIIMTKKTAFEYKNINFILRPHPSESLDIYLKEFSDINNINVVNKGNVHYWISEAKAVIHYDCTTGIESVLSGTPTLAYVPDKNKEVFAWLPAYVSDECKEDDQIVERIGEILNDEYSFILTKEKQNVLDGYICNSKVNSSKVIAEHLKGMLKHLGSTKNVNILNRNFKRIEYRLKGFYNRNIVRGKSVSRKKMGILKRVEISKKLETLLQIEEIQKNFSIKRAGDNVLEIIPKK